MRHLPSSHSSLGTKSFLHSFQKGTFRDAHSYIDVKMWWAMISITINGKLRSFDCDVRTSLLDLLRNHAGLTGTKKGCDHGQCGACTIIVNGRRINACLSLAVMHDGDEIATIEGIGSASNLSPLQRAFVSNDAYQCGYCTPGQICSATAMLAEVEMGWPSAVTGDITGSPALDDTEIRERMSGNLCRCAAYPNIVAAIREQAAAIA